MTELDTQRPFDEYPALCIDVETTGLASRGGDRICEIAVVRLERGVVTGTYCSLVNPCRAISPGAFAVNGISEDMVSGAPLFEEVAPALRAMLEGAVHVAHNAPFDMSFLDEEFKRSRMRLPRAPVLDTLLLARRAYTFKNNSLGALAGNLGVAQDGEHRALADALTTAGVLGAILAHLRARGLLTLGDLLAFQRGATVRRESGLPDGELHPLIEEAIATSGALKITYCSARGKTSRVVKPTQLSAFGAQCYMTAYCFLRGEERVFRLDRIVKVERAEPA